MAEYFEIYFSQLKYGVNYILTGIAFALSITLVFNTFKYDWKGYLIKLADWIITYGLYLLFVSSYYVLVTPMFMDFIAWLTVVFLHMSLCNNMQWQERILKSFVMVSFLNMIPSLTSAIGASLNIWSEDIIFVLVFTVIETFFLIYFKTPSLSKINIICYILECIISIGLTVFTNLINYKRSSYSFTFQITFFIFLYVIAMIVYYLYYKITKETEKLARANTEIEACKMSQTNLDDLRKLRHDQKNQYLYMKNLIDNQNYDELQKFFCDILETTAVPLTFVDCGNDVVSGLMNIEIKKADELNIKIHHSIIIPQTINISQNDLFRFFSNAIDNAIEATDRCTMEGDKIINIKIFYQKPYVFLNIENPCESKFDENGKSIKKGPNHGFGKEIMNDIARRYNGTINKSINGNTYIFHAMLKETEEKQK